MSDQSIECKKCNDEYYLLVGCCSGRECGCRGGPVGVENCDVCNRDNTKEMPVDFSGAEYLEHIEDYSKDLTKQEATK